MLWAPLLICCATRILRCPDLVGIGIQYPKLFGEVFDGLNDNDPVVRMRAADVIEKVTQGRPEFLSGYTSQVMAMLVSGPDCTTPFL